MSDVCNKCGLPMPLCICSTIAKEQSQTIEVIVEKRKFGKIITVIKGLDPKNIDLDQVMKELKRKFACGGTNKSGIIELQGDHKFRAKESLIDLGFSPEQIVIK